MFKFIQIKIIVLVFITSIIFNSCRPITEVEIILVPETEQVEPGDTAHFSIVVIPDALNGGKLGEVEIMNIDSSILQNFTLTGRATDSVIFEYFVDDSAQLNSSVSFIICAYDNPQAKTYKNAVIEIRLLTPEILKAENVQTFFSGATLEDTLFVELSTSGVILSDANSSSADLAFVWDATYGYSIVSPNSQWISDLYLENGIEYLVDDKKQTDIQLSDSTWTYFGQNSIDEIVVESDYLQGGTGIGVQNLKEDDILVFQLRDGRKGAMKINIMTKDNKYLISDFKYQIEY